MLFSLNCLISRQTPVDIFTVPIGEFFNIQNDVQNITAKFADMTVANLKDQLFCTDEIKEAKITKMNIWKAEIELDSLEDKPYTEEEIKDISTIMNPGCNLDKYYDNDKKKPKKNHLHIFIVPTSTATTLTSILSSQQPISPSRRDFDHKFYNREKAMDQIAKIANMNYANRLSTYHQNHYFILVPGGSGIGKSRVGMESQHLISIAEETALKNIGSNLVKDALNDPCYIFIDFNNGCKYLRKLDKMYLRPTSVRIGARVAVASGIAGKILEDLPEESLNLYRLDDVMQEILHRRFETTHRRLEAVIIHIDEYQLYIDYVQRVEKEEWEVARNFFKEMLNEIGYFMSNQKMNKSENEFFIIPICTGTSAIDIHFLHTEYNKVLVHLKPLNYSSAIKMFFDKYDSIETRNSENSCDNISKQEHFRIALFDTGFVPKFLSYFLTPEAITTKTDWGNNLHYLMNAPVMVDPDNPGYWKNRNDIRTIVSFGLTRQIVKRNFQLPSKTSIGDIERDGLIFLANPEGYPDDEFIIIIPFMLLKILNQKLLPHPFFPDEFLLIPTTDRPWWWQDFECLHGYYQRALIEALINVKNARIQFLKKQLTDSTSKEINDLEIRLVNEEQKSWCLSDIFRGAKGNANLLKYQVKLRQLDVFIEKNKLLVETTDIAEFNRLVLCDDDITRPLETAIFHCAEGCANIDHHWVLESASNEKPLAIFMQDKHSEFDTNDPTVSGPELKRWYDKTLQSVSSYTYDYDILLVFFTVRRFTGSNLWEMPWLLLIDDECIAEYLSPTFAHRGLVSPPDNYDLEQVLSFPISDEFK
ncbi:8894_t:CDS:2 [Funneliformis geosporum]|uniref:8894_t:CDS:1 n=1 Tax=Funneliformis geosporum TaxID=1117311 RepID=A0A9W4ST07_9GLOM|nr:8894_t:CDS:2 [Funneliformis geosporum]